MTLAGIRPSDLVRVEIKGRVFIAEVRSRPVNGRIEIDPIERGITYRSAKAREVICHWAKRGRPRTQRALAQDLDEQLAS
jgi:hypothetical protein